MSFDANPYAGHDLHVPRAWHESYQRYSRVGRSEGGDLDSAPFARMVDMWWIALGIGVRQQQRTSIGDDPVKFETGTILNSDPWRITHLGLIAIAVEGDEVLERPGDVIRIANEYAATGSEHLVTTMAGHAKPVKPLLAWLREQLLETED
jgi:hypothetical protein